MRRHRALACAAVCLDALLAGASRQIAKLNADFVSPVEGAFVRDGNQPGFNHHARNRRGWRRSRASHAPGHLHQRLGSDIDAIDNLLKGASGQAIHNMNISFGFPENAGLKLKSIAF